MAPTLPDRPGLYYWSMKYRYYFGIQAIKQRTDLLRAHLPNAGVGAIQTVLMALGMDVTLLFAAAVGLGLANRIPFRRTVAYGVGAVAVAIGLSVIFSIPSTSTEAPRNAARASAHTVRGYFIGQRMRGDGRYELALRIPNLDFGGEAPPWNRMRPRADQTLDKQKLTVR